MVESPLGFILIPAIPPAVHMLSRIRVFPVFLPVSNAHLDGELIPVSYTHLDVYKRQSQWLYESWLVKIS